ncbi:MAG: hypothetical protein ACNA8L_10260 [Luteolibacter sp.]
MPEPIELNAASEETVGPIREALRAAEKIRALRYPDAEVTPPTSALPEKSLRIGKLLGFGDDGEPVMRSLVIDNIELGDDAPGDIYYRDSSGDLARLPIGTTGQGLKVAGGLPVWDDVASAIADLNLGSGATGDLYYRNSSGVLVKLAIGTTGQVLTVAGGLPAWDDAEGGGGGSGEGGLLLEGIASFQDTWYITPSGLSTTAGAAIELPDYSVMRFRILITARYAGYYYTNEIRGAIRRIANSSETALLGTVTYDALATASHSLTCTATAGNGGLRLTVSGSPFSQPVTWRALIFRDINILDES